jgi:hypothetical protein
MGLRAASIKATCHFERSEAQSRNLLLSSVL